MSEIDIVPMTGDAVLTFVPDLARLRLQVFREFPYLYDGTMEYEEHYLQTYIHSPDSIIVLAFDGSRVVGASTGVPLAHETDEIKHPFFDEKIPISQVFYLGESVLEQSYRGRGIGVRFFEHREAHARRLGGYKYTSFCAVDRPIDHPRRPPGYKDLHTFWAHRGYIQRMHMKTFFNWRDLDEEIPSAKSMIFWTKELV